jgi:hypothetical protein
MSENPERKILKETLVELRTKIMDRQKIFSDFSLKASETVNHNLKDMSEAVMKMPLGQEKNIGILLLSGLVAWKQIFETILNNNVILVGDMNSYISALEKYSSELSSIFEEAEKKYKAQLEEQQKQQEELMKKQPSYRA